MTLRAPLWAEGFGYSALNDRQLTASLMQPGVVGTNDLKCAAGTGFTSTIAKGRGAVEGNFKLEQGIYVVQNDGPLIVTHPNPHATFPRVDQVGIKVYDSIDGGDASSVPPVPLILEGVPTTGATLVDPKGIAVHPFNFLELARVLVPAASKAAVEFIYEDRRRLANASVGLSTRISREANFEAKPEEFAECKKTLTSILPVPIDGTICAFYNAPVGSGEETTIKQHAAESIVGDFIGGVAAIKLAQWQHVVLRADGVNWLIIAGEPKLESKYSALMLLAPNENHLVSAIRPALVTISPEYSGGGIPSWELQVFVGGAEITRYSYSANPSAGWPSPFQFYVPAGQEWQVKTLGSTGLSAIHTSWILL